MMQKTLAILMLLCVVGSLAACNTVAGVGRDVERAGTATENAANRNR
jgi:predicted small secreted protein